MEATQSKHASDLFDSREDRRSIRLAQFLHDAKRAAVVFAALGVYGFCWWAMT